MERLRMSGRGEQGVVDEAEVVATRDAAGRFLPGNGLGGRPKGSGNRFGRQFVLDVHESYEELGGVSEAGA